ncbi:MAG TPA: hypothetical protein VFZ28_01900 [Burkholderiaceae bacterium]|nr:hypothetical protein [Burkholderiaceae bacterium]
MRALLHPVAAVVIALATVVLAVLASAPVPQTMPSPTAAAALPIVAPPPDVAAPARVTAARALSEPSRLAAARTVSLRERIEALLSRPTPRERYQEAFVLLAHCAHAIDFDRYLKALPVGDDTRRLRQRYGDGTARIAAACGDLSAREVEQRIALAAGAADEGVPGAASAWIEEGPYGDRTALTQRPDDPLIVEWAERAIERVHAATRRADTEAISQYALLSLNWDLDDVARVRLLVDDAVQRRREERIKAYLE